MRYAPVFEAAAALAFFSPCARTAVTNTIYETYVVEEKVPEGYDGPNWAVTVRDAEIFSSEGEKIGTIDAGVALETTGCADFKDGAAAECTKINGDGTKFFVYEYDLASFFGPYTFTPEDVRRKAAEYFELSAKYDKLKKAEIEKLRPDNPFAEELAAAEKEKKQIAEKVDRLGREAQALAGAKRTKAYETLSRMKYEANTASDRLFKAKVNAEKWNKEHPFDPSKINPAETPEMKSVLLKMNRLKEELAEICPGIFIEN